MMENLLNQKYKTLTFKSDEVPKEIRSDIEDLFNLVFNLKKDDLLENYKKFKIEDQCYVTAQYNYDNQLEHVSSIFKRKTYPENTYRVHNRFMRNPYYRMNSPIADPILRKVIHEGIQPTHMMLDQQIKTVEDINCDFYFFSRQVLQRRVWNKYVEKFNETFNRNLKISENRYWICYGKSEDCAQYLVYPEDKHVPFIKY